MTGEWEETRRLVEQLQAVLGRLDQIGEDRLLTAEEVADRLNMKKRWVYDQAKAGTIPHHKWDRTIRFDWREVQKWLADNQKGGRRAA